MDFVTNCIIGVNVWAMGVLLCLPFMRSGTAVALWPIFVPYYLAAFTAKKTWKLSKWTMRKISNGVRKATRWAFPAKELLEYAEASEQKPHVANHTPEMCGHVTLKLECPDFEGFHQEHIETHYDQLRRATIKTVTYVKHDKNYFRYEPLTWEKGLYSPFSTYTAPMNYGISDSTAAKC